MTVQCCVPSFSAQLQLWSFQVAETSNKYVKIKKNKIQNARACWACSAPENNNYCFCTLNVQIRDVFVAVAVVIGQAFKLATTIVIQTHKEMRTFKEESPL